MLTACTPVRCLLAAPPYAFPSLPSLARLPLCTLSTVGACAVGGVCVLRNGHTDHGGNGAGGVIWVNSLLDGFDRSRLKKGPPEV